MYIHDLIYGSFDVTEPVLLELLEDPTVKRVAGVMQGGTTPQLWGWPDFSRLEHCVGAMLLVRHLGGSLEEQVAALLHDVPHTAFSHVIDVVFNNHTLQNFHEEVKEELFAKSMIPTILKKYGFKLSDILDESRYGLLERASPMLCADRVDYALRIIPYYFNDLHLARRLASHLTAFEGQVVFDSGEPASLFARSFLRFARDVIAGLDNMASYEVLAETIKYALEERYLRRDDLFSTDELVMEKLLAIKDEFVQLRLQLLKPGFTVIEDANGFNYMTKTKTRWVNPPFLENGVMKYVLDEDAELAQEVGRYKERVQQPFYIKVVGL